ncbi:MAG: isoprenylcysteine carboxylmethyltransferase family protein [Rhizomicrobium sp.]|jgi:protein-S-isoprenylcysteine O-methyltransferase Ste14
MTAETLQSGTAAAPRADAKIFDLLACSPLVVWYGIWIVKQAPGLAHDVAKLVAPQASFLPVIDVFSRLAVFLFAAVLIFMLVARRPAAAKAPGVFPRLAAFLGAYLGVGILTLPLHPLNWEMKTLSTLFILGGMSFALWGLLYLGRSISIMSEARKLVVGGPYAVVRHPLYLGEQLALIGVALQYVSPLAIVLLALQLRFQLYRMKFEEQILAEAFPEYSDYARDTWRLIPGIY